MNIDAINSRIDEAIRRNRRTEILCIVMAFGIFLLGMGMLLLAYSEKNPYVGGGTFLVQTFLYWPIRAILKLRKDAVMLQTMPILIAQLPPRAAALEMQKMVEYLRSKKQ